MKAMRLQSSHVHAQRGQAVVETVVVLTVLAVFLLLIPLIGKYQDIAHQTQMASRYVAWQSLVQNDAAGGSLPDATRLARDVRRRFFGPSNAPVFTDDNVDNMASYRNPMWTDHLGAPMLADFNNVSVSFGSGTSTNASDGFTNGGTLSGVYPEVAFLAHTDTFDLNDRGLFTGAVQVRLANVNSTFLAPFDNLNLVMRRHTSVMPDTFATSTAQRVEARVTKSTLAFAQNALRVYRYAPMVPIMALEDNANGLPGNGIQAPLLGEVDFWRDVVPADRTRPR
jgi:hypothetical protein